MKHIFILLLLAGLAGFGCSKTGDTAPDTAETNASSGNPLTAPTDYLGALNQAQKAAKKVSGNASLQKAIQMFQAEEGRQPATLQEVVDKKYIRELPALPKGMKYQYNPKTGEVKVAR